MIFAKRENIYGLDVFTFVSSQRIPYQLTFDESISPKHTEISLVNLLGQSDSKYCKYLRAAVSQYIYEYLNEKKCTLYFNIELKDTKRIVLFKKFIRWTHSEPRIKTILEITPYNNTQFIEFRLKINSEYIKNLKVK